MVLFILRGYLDGSRVVRVNSGVRLARGPRARRVVVMVGLRCQESGRHNLVVRASHFMVWVTFWPEFAARTGSRISLRLFLVLLGSHRGWRKMLSSHSVGALSW